MIALFRYLKENLLFFLLAICIHVSPMPLMGWTQYLYILAFAFIAIYAFENGRESYKADTFWCFIGVCCLASLVNVELDIRLFFFSVAIIILSPITYSLKLAVFRERLLRFLLMASPVLAIVSLYCYRNGINMMEYNDATGIEWNFCALYGHPMFLSAIMGLSTVVSTWNALSTRNFYMKILWTLSILLSVYLTVISASRTALTASILCAAGLVIFNTKNFGRFIKYSIIIALLAMVAVPVFYEKSGRIQDKMEASSDKKYGSRSGIFDDGFEHFEKQPILGCGFAVQYRDGKRYTGRFEAGSGWLSILFQTGIVGFCVMLGILCKIMRNIRFLRNDHNLQFFFFAFVYLCLHSCFEGYILSIGNINFMIFWLFVSVLYTYQHTCMLRMNFT